MTMTSEDGDILALLSEPSLNEEQLEASQSDDILPAILDAIKSNEKIVELSPEEAAWADSCFVQTTELSDDDWAAMRGALLDALEKPSESTYDTLEGDHGIHAISEAKHRSLDAEKNSQHNDVLMEQIDNSDDGKDSTEACEVTDVILGADEHGKQVDSYAVEPENGDELASSLVPEQSESADSIFKIWDLKASFSDDDSELELIKDLKKLLKDSPPEDVYPLPPDDAAKPCPPEDVYPLPPDDAAKPLSQISINELVAGLRDLSIQQTNE